MNIQIILIRPGVPTHINTYVYECGIKTTAATTTVTALPASLRNCHRSFELLQLHAYIPPLLRCLRATKAQRLLQLSMLVSFHSCFRSAAIFLLHFYCTTSVDNFSSIKAQKSCYKM